MYEARLRTPEFYRIPMAVGFEYRFLITSRGISTSLGNWLNSAEHDPTNLCFGFSI